MADYVLLYTGGGEPPSEEERAAALAAWTDWFAQIGEALKDGGNPFGPAAKAVASDGSVRDATGTLHSGYTIVSADSLEAATAVAKGSPVLQGGGSVTVYETFSAM
ncbi:MAG TPA: hypothetical protein VFT80_11280 [Actinomycetota bacterium]|nr:hypothetical protein [Actinomycetota bacterium]